MIIINEIEHNGNIEENNAHIETPGLIEDHDKTLYGENP